MILNDRRRSALPAELVGRVFAVWFVVALLQIAVMGIAGSLAGGTPPVWGLPTRWAVRALLLSVSSLGKCSTAHFVT